MINEPTSIRLGPKHNFERRLVEDWHYCWLQDNVLYGIRIKSGEHFKPSIPWVAYSLIPPSRLEPASLAHDALYRRQGVTHAPRHTRVHLYRRTADGWKSVSHVSRSWTDRMFDVVNENFGVEPWRRKLAFRAVRWFGEWAWIEKDEATR